MPFQIPTAGLADEKSLFIAGEDAARHDGEPQTVHGKVADTVFLSSSKDQVTGKIESRGEKFQMVVTDPAQIEVHASSPTASVK